MSSPPAARSVPVLGADHRRCVVCGRDNLTGLQVNYARQADGSVAAEFDCADRYQGYPGLLYGGVIAALLDGAMTHCLLDQGVVAVTAELRVRYLQPVMTGEAATVVAQLRKAGAHLYLLTASLRQGGLECARGEAKFRERKHGSGMAADSTADLEFSRHPCDRADPGAAANRDVMPDIDEGTSA